MLTVYCTHNIRAIIHQEIVPACYCSANMGNHKRKIREMDKKTISHTSTSAVQKQALPSILFGLYFFW